MPKAIQLLSLQLRILELEIINEQQVTLMNRMNQENVELWEAQRQLRDQYEQLHRAYQTLLGQGPSTNLN